MVLRCGLTVRQTEALVEAVLTERDPAARRALLARRPDERATRAPPGPRPTRPTRMPRSDVDPTSIDILRMLEIAARLEA